MSVTITGIRRQIAGSGKEVIADLAFDSVYPTGGEPLTPEELGLRSIDFLIGESPNGYKFEYDYSNEKLKVFWPALGPLGAANLLHLEDDDNAATEGVLMYIHLDEAITEATSYWGHIECVNAGNANSYFRVRASGPTCLVKDDDLAATGGVRIYVDEDHATGAGYRWVADLDSIQSGAAGTAALDKIVFVPLSNGEFIAVHDQDDAATAGVSPYFDDDAATDYERIQFVSPTNVDNDGVTWGFGGEVENGVTLAALTGARVFIKGDNPQGSSK